MTAKTSFRGSFTALVTPFKNGSLDEKAFRGIVEWQIAEGTNGLVPVGTTGESPTLSHARNKNAIGRNRRLRRLRPRRLRVAATPVAAGIAVYAMPRGRRGEGGPRASSAP